MQYIATLLLLFIFFHLGVMEAVLHQLGISQVQVGYAMAGAIVLSLINVRLFSFRLATGQADRPAAKQRPGQSAGGQGGCVAVNLGGCILPLVFCLYLLKQAPINPYHAGLLVFFVSAVVYPLCRIEGARGVVINLFGAVASSATGAVLLGGENYLVWAYGAAVVGTFIGGDLFHLMALSRSKQARREGIFIGGHGLMDAIFLSGIFAMMAAEVIHQKQLLRPVSWQQVEASAPAYSSRRGTLLPVLAPTQNDAV